MDMSSDSIPVSCLSQFYLNYGFHPITEADVYSHFSPAHDLLEHTYDFFQRIHQDLSLAYQTMKVDQQLMKAKEDRHHRSSDIVVGDEVLVNVRKFDRPSFSTIHKLMQSYAGPFRVIAVIGSNAFKVELPP